MKKTLIILALVLAPLAINAQKFGHVNIQQIAQALPDYSQAMTDLQNLQKQYEEDLNRLSEEFNKKYEDYKMNEATLPANIKERRESELQELNSRMQQYYQESQQNLAQANQEKMAAVMDKVLNAVKEVGSEGSYVYIMDITSGAAFINEAISVDVTDAVKAKLGIK